MLAGSRRPGAPGATLAPGALGFLLLGVAATCGGALVGCAGAEPGGAERGERGERIVGGSVDDVSSGVVFVYDVSRGQLCSGSLIAPNLVLTARHCVAAPSAVPGKPAGAISCGESTFGQASAASSLSIGWSTAVSKEGLVPGVEVLVPEGISSVCDADVALVVLASPLAQPPLTPRLGSRAALGEAYTAVGYGATSWLGPGTGTRRSRAGLSVMCAGSCGALASGNGTDWQGEAGVCEGDSGGPALDAAGEIIGVTSRSTDGCHGPIYADVAAWGAFLRGGAARAAERSGGELPAWARSAVDGHEGPAGGASQGGAGADGGGEREPMEPPGAGCSLGAAALQSVAPGERRRGPCSLPRWAWLGALAALRLAARRARGGQLRGPVAG
jgi:hypothetical protein